METKSTGGDGDVPITGVTVTPETMSLKVGETADLAVSVVPADTTQSKALNWTSSDTNIVTVDNNGKVTAVKEGTVTITATSVANNTISATCEVTVTTGTGGEVLITGVTIDRRR